jgi:hypothetical protein
MASKKTTSKKTVKKSKAKAKTITLEPAVRYLRYRLTNSAEAGTETSHFIDLARDLSRVNRRMYRQGRDYHVKRISVVSTNTIAGIGGAEGLVGLGSVALSQQNAGFFSVSVVGASWVATKAWHRGFTAWRNMNRDAMRKTNDIDGTWADYKVYMSTTMRTAAAAGDLLDPVDNGNNQYLPGEWIYSKYVAPTAAAGVVDEYTAHMVGNHSGAPGAYNSIGLIKSYGEARATVNNLNPAVPVTAPDDPLVNLFDYGDTQNELITNIIGDNDDPPYDHLEYPGDDANGPKPIVVGQTSIGDGSSTIGSFSALAGLLELETFSPIASDIYSVLVELAPGKYRGIKAGAIE